MQDKIDAQAAGLDSARLERITQHINENYIAPGKIAGCQIQVSRKGITAYSKTFGLMDKERNKPLQDDTIFRIYSMSKPITSVALMMLYEKGKFQLSDPVHRFIPSWKNHRVYVSGEGESLETKIPNSPVTMRQILSHSGGLSYGATRHPADQIYKKLKIRNDAEETLAHFVDKLSKVPLRYEPGEAWMYSLSTDVCGYLVEAISGMPFDEYLETEIFKPLGMKDTSFNVEPEKIPRLAANYTRLPDKSLGLFDDPENSTYSQKKKFFSGGGGLLSTTRDYRLFCEMLRQGGELNGVRLLGPRTLELMTLNHLKNGKSLYNLALGSFSETAYEGIGFGLGFAMTIDQKEAGSLSLKDYYWGGAASTVFWIDPVEDLIVIFMTQLMPSQTFDFRRQLKSLVYSAIVE
ncbi:MAG: CubicO group peptidase (beta-lactamase class C family) [Candidatus Azotimanducaceae bacterium]|jgi:CubicO group peptidase (beta-lactamase class C family)